MYILLGCKWIEPSFMTSLGWEKFTTLDVVGVAIRTIILNDLTNWARHSNIFNLKFEVIFVPHAPWTLSYLNQRYKCRSKSRLCFWNLKHPSHHAKISTPLGHILKGRIRISDIILQYFWLRSITLYYFEQMLEHH